ncbi:MAG: hypothetical protein R3185_06430, partial [Candidatus Thermoplasmatota archaeon]|nr:hypothetical protein [Candidatus Thermoplasmatota archaeon]
MTPARTLGLLLLALTLLSPSLPASSQGDPELEPGVVVSPHQFTTKGLSAQDPLNITFQVTTDAPAGLGHVTIRAPPGFLPHTDQPPAPAGFVALGLTDQTLGYTAHFLHTGPGEAPERAGFELAFQGTHDVAHGVHTWRVTTSETVALQATGARTHWVPTFVDNLAPVLTDVELLSPSTPGWTDAPEAQLAWSVDEQCPPSGWEMPCPVDVIVDVHDAQGSLLATHTLAEVAEPGDGTGVLDLAHEGEITLRLTAVDGAGLTDPAEPVTLKVDRAPPITSIPEGLTQGWHASPVTVEPTCQDAHAGCQATTYTLDG